MCFQDLVITSLCNLFCFLNWRVWNLLLSLLFFISRCVSQSEFHASPAWQRSTADCERIAATHHKASPAVLQGSRRTRWLLRSPLPLKSILSISKTSLFHSHYFYLSHSSLMGALPWQILPLYPPHLSFRRCQRKTRTRWRLQESKYGPRVNLNIYVGATVCQLPISSAQVLSCRFWLRQTSLIVIAFPAELYSWTS